VASSRTGDEEIFSLLPPSSSELLNGSLPFDELSGEDTSSNLPVPAPMVRRRLKVLEQLFVDAYVGCPRETRQILAKVGVNIPLSYAKALDKDKDIQRAIADRGVGINAPIIEDLKITKDALIRVWSSLALNSKDPKVVLKSTELLGKTYGIFTENRNIKVGKGQEEWLDLLDAISKEVEKAGG